MINECPEQIASSIHEVQTLVKQLVHDSKNDYANYKYVSIDAYYEAVRPWLNTAGLTIIPNELESQISPDGRTLKMTFEFIFIHKSGATWLTPIKRTVYLPYTGAQSCGSALSYAEKFILRTTFKIPTGEYDAEQDAEHKADADAIAPVRRGQDSTIGFDYSGAPYRIFNESKAVINTFTDVKGWGLALKKRASVDNKLVSGVYENQEEIKRIRAEVEEDKSLNIRSKNSLIKAIDGLTPQGV